jgi:hypothetical protein
MHMQQQALESVYLVANHTAYLLTIQQITVSANAQPIPIYMQISILINASINAQITVGLLIIKLKLV